MCDTRHISTNMGAASDVSCNEPLVHLMGAALDGETSTVKFLKGKIKTTKQNFRGLFRAVSTVKFTEVACSRFFLFSGNLGVSVTWRSLLYSAF